MAAMKILLATGVVMAGCGYVRDGMVDRNVDIRYMEMVMVRLAFGKSVCMIRQDRSRRAVRDDYLEGGLSEARALADVVFVENGATILRRHTLRPWQVFAFRISSLRGCPCRRALLA